MVEGLSPAHIGYHIHYLPSSLSGPVLARDWLPARVTTTPYPRRQHRAGVTAGGATEVRLQLRCIASLLRGVGCEGLPLALPLDRIAEDPQLR